MIKTWLGRGLTLAAVLLTSGLAQADVVTHAGAKVQIDIPSGWKQEQKANSMVITAPDGNMSVVFVVLEGDEVDAAFEAMDKQVEKEFGPVTWAKDGEAVHEDINGMETDEWNGTAKDGALQVDVLAINTPADKALAVYWFTDTASAKKYEPALKQIVRGLKPAK
jgi:hypothetical protein